MYICITMQMDVLLASCTKGCDEGGGGGERRESIGR